MGTYNAQVQSLSGQRFTRLLVLEQAGRTPGRSVLWKCICDCGAVTVVSSQSLKRGTTRSCGCLKRDATLARGTKHGEASGKRTPEYNTWAAIKNRCFRPTCISYPNYGGRGITMCDRWRDSFEAFLSDMGRRPSASHQIDRQDNDGDYEPNNCVWNTRREQSHNRSDNVVVSVGGEQMVLAEALIQFGVIRTTYSKRIARGLSVEAALGIADTHLLQKRSL